VYLPEGRLVNHRAWLWGRKRVPNIRAGDNRAVPDRHRCRGTARRALTSGNVFPRTAAGQSRLTRRPPQGKISQAAVCRMDATRLQIHVQAKRMKVRELIRLLEEDGWQQVRMRGSHRQFRHPTKPGTLTVAGKPGADIPAGTLSALLKHAGLKQRRSS